MTTPKQPIANISDAEAIELWGTLIKAVGLTNRNLQKQLRDQFGLNEAEVDTLIELGGRVEGRATLTELARSAAFTSGGYTKVTDRLCDRGLVRRTAHTSDRRVTELELTAEGCKMADELRALVAEINRRQFIEVIGLERARSVAQTLEEIRLANQ